MFALGLLSSFAVVIDIDTKCTVALPNHQCEIQAISQAFRADLVYRASEICSISGYQR